MKTQSFLGGAALLFAATVVLACAHAPTEDRCADYCLAVEACDGPYPDCEQVMCEKGIGDARVDGCENELSEMFDCYASSAAPCEEGTCTKQSDALYACQAAYCFANPDSPVCNG